MTRKQELLRIEAYAKGLVQGVGYRYFVITKAAQLGLTGYAQNLPDGSVAVLAEGSREDLESLIAVLRTGPRAAKVTDVDVSWRAGTGEYKAFGVKH